MPVPSFLFFFSSSSLSPRPCLPPDQELEVLQAGSHASRVRRGSAALLPEVCASPPEPIPHVCSHEGGGGAFPWSLQVAEAFLPQNRKQKAMSLALSASQQLFFLLSLTQGKPFRFEAGEACS